jgi:hypothetical protein
MKEAKVLCVHPISKLRPGRVVLDCSGPIHREWLREALFNRGLKVLVYRHAFKSDQMDALPVHADLQMASGDLNVVLSRLRSAVNLIVDDLGTYHFHEQPLILLRSYYEALSSDGEAWIRFPRTHFVLLANGKRISLQDYLPARYPTIAKRLRPVEMDPSLIHGVSSTEDWILIRKDRGIPALTFDIHLRTRGGTTMTTGTHSAYLEFVEVQKGSKGGWFRKAA